MLAEAPPVGGADPVDVEAAAQEAEAAVLRQLSIVALPSVLARLSPGTATALPSTKNRGQYGRLYVCAKKAYAARYAHEVLGAET